MEAVILKWWVDAICRSRNARDELGGNAQHLNRPNVKSSGYNDAAEWRTVTRPRFPVVTSNQAEAEHPQFHRVRARRSR